MKNTVKNYLIRHLSGSNANQFKSFDFAGQGKPTIAVKNSWAAVCSAFQEMKQVAEGAVIIEMPDKEKQNRSLENGQKWFR